MSERNTIFSAPRKHTIYISMGSNLNYPVAQLKRAIQEIAGLPQTTVTDISSLYYSAPLGPRFQPWYFNCVIAIESRVKPQRLLQMLHKIEKTHRRKRRKRWGPRTLDLDILLFGQQRIRYQRLTVPHPQMIKRAFVLVPLAEITADLTIPNHGKIADIASRISTDNLVKVTK